MIDIDKLEALEKEAIPSPWISIKGCLDRAPTGYDPSTHKNWIAYSLEDICRNPICFGVVGEGGQSDCAFTKGNAEFIVAMRNALPELLAEVRRLRQVEKWADAYIDACLIRVKTLRPLVKPGTC